MFNPKALVYHRRYPRGGARNNFKKDKVYFANQFNYGYFLGKNFSLLENVLCLTRRLPYQIIKDPKAILYILKGLIYAKK